MTFLRTLTLLTPLIPSMIGVTVTLDSPTSPRAVTARGSATRAPAPTRLVILGADHSAQLVGRRNHPGYLRVFLDRLKPDVICIEQPPEEYARGVFYFEATYEQQYVAVPYARAHHIEVRPIDWIPPRDDERLAFGRLEVVDVPAIRPPNDFQSFLTFDSTAIQRSFFFADSLPWREEARRFFDTPRPGRRDFPRRLDLYRTFMQAMRVRAATAHHPGETVLVVVGATHKDDLERILADDKQIEIVQPSALVASIDSATATQALTSSDRFAIASANILGVQSSSAVVDWGWVESIVGELARERGASAEVRLLQARLGLLRGKISPAAALGIFEAIANDSAAGVPFSFTGVQDTWRVDSYFDPFGNLNVRQRAMVEAAKVHASFGAPLRVKAMRDALWSAAPWSPLQEGELSVYWRRYVETIAGASRPR
ncbi:MAG: hypothetical protein ABIT38_14020 [Gemmatimonadaceae bacterium]